MNAWWAFFLGTGATGGILSFSYTVYKDFRDRRRLERKVEGEIQIDDATEKRIVAEAAQINSDVAIAQQNWWKTQFDLVRTELVEEQRLRQKLTKWAAEHQVWDQRAWTSALKSDPDCPPPPHLELD